MKKLLHGFMMVIILETGCHSNDNPTQGNNTTSTTTTVSTETTPAGDGNDNTLKLADAGGTAHVFVGIFATWNSPDKSSYDGSYDTEAKLFFICQSKKFLNVPADQITMVNFGSCDEVKSEFMIYDKKPGDFISLVPGVLTLEGNKGIIKDGSTIRTVNFNSAIIHRIEDKKRVQLEMKRPNIINPQNDSIKMVTPHHFQNNANVDTPILMRPRPDLQAPVIRQPINHKEPEKMRRQPVTH